ncbi:AbrB family transcriptional regulator [Pararhodobacter sp.]|uniref:AbrB family transcriptional regulator n=1 Tax=Pararhodobacter sp. TaxID=2127056 RepID=UPI002B00205F|nr:AbrB family transcriptional regulator [Pararhodobacter sp.]
MPSLSRITEGVPLVAIVATFALGGIGGLAAMVAGLPLAMLLGSMVTTAAAAMLGVRFFGHAPAVPQSWRFVLVPVIGVAIGASFPQDFIDQAQRWWVTIAALFAFIPVAHALGYALFHKLGRLSPQTAYYAAMPGGFVESLDMGEKAGADMTMLIMLQFLRLILCIVLIPIGFSIFEGHAVGSGAGMSLGPRSTLTALDVGVLGFLAVAGWLIASKLRIPAAVLAGPLLLSGLAHATGFTDAAPPIWTIQVTQWVMGTSLGVRLAGFTKGQAGVAVVLSLTQISLVLLIALGVGLVLAGPVGEPVAAVILAFAPGGVTEMSLVALSLHLSAVYVTLHHLARIILTVFVARLGQRFLPPAV